MLPVENGLKRVGEQEDGLESWVTDPGPSTQLQGQLTQTPCPPTPPCIPAQAVFAQKVLPANPWGKPRLAERDIQKPPTLQLPVRWILLPDRVREIPSLLLTKV